MLHLSFSRDPEDETPVTVCALPCAHTTNSPDFRHARTTLAEPPETLHVRDMQSRASQLERVVTNVKEFVSAELNAELADTSCTVLDFVQTGLLSCSATVRVEVLEESQTRVLYAKVEDREVRLLDRLS